MTNIVEKSLSKKGQFANLEWVRPCKTVKSCTSTITKQTKAFNVRIGCSYDNLKTTKEGRANGTLPQENQGLRGKEWVQYPVILKSTKTQKQYIRLETAKNTKFETVYYVDGKEVKKADIEQYLYSSEKKQGEKPTVMDISIENIRYIK